MYRDIHNTISFLYTILSHITYSYFLFLLVFIYVFVFSCVNMFLFLSWSKLIATSTTSGEQIWIGKHTTQAQSPYWQTIQPRLNQIARTQKLHSGSELPCCTAPSNSLRPKANRLGSRKKWHIGNKRVEDTTLHIRSLSCMWRQRDRPVQNKELSAHCLAVFLTKIVVKK